MGKINILFCLACDEVILLVTVINYGVLALNAIVNAKYNKSFLVVCRECILFSFFFSSGFCSVFVLHLVQTSFVCSCSFILSVLTCTIFVTGFSWVFFPVIILDICELILSLLGIHVVMQCNDAIIWVLAYLPLLPFRGNQVQGTLYLKKKSV